MAGGAVAATGQHVLATALPAVADGASALSLGINGLVGPDMDFRVAADAAPLVADPPPAAAVAGVDPAPVIADAASLVKVADLQRSVTDAAARTADQAAAKAEQAKAEAARAEQAKKAAAPVADLGRAIQMVTGRVTSGFGLRAGTTHQGLDIAAPIGTPIRVPIAGTVISSGPATGFGLWVRVRHADGTITVYGHINRSLVKVGQKVAAGQQIAEVGNRGQSTGPHLHIEVITPAGKKINPRPWLDQHGILY
ncbi:M23 family metallopeptidase [Pseudonocardia alaniniphila]|uniref:M23 family metallopeptidase n=1 Tax=Pseudonocardia alaniniphila TaxID=75291 RepID=A0ABS9TC30_9PSEU|nr:M23 family metallopeptidase [Pseudonocardia alaniniphila]MCH6166095.1 M23 family metallopeptidase [Pseudonocardia alaniniphila]